jgi:hypothetical protein
MQKPTYRVIPRKDGHAFDIEMTAPNSPPRIVNCFNKESEAWQWMDQQLEVESFARRQNRSAKKRDPT